MLQSLIQSFADRISGQEYPLRDSNLDIEYAKANNLVIVFGNSDDLLEFRGAIDESINAFPDGALAYISNGKAISESELIQDQKVLQKYGFLTTLPPLSVEAIWDPEGIDAMWLIKVMGVESASFTVMEDGSVFCHGAVFQL